MTDRKTLYRTWATAEFHLMDTLHKLAASHYEIGLVAERLAGADGLPDEERYALLREIDKMTARMRRLDDLAVAWEKDTNVLYRNVAEMENGLTREEVVEMATSCGRMWDDVSHLPSGVPDAS